MGLRSLDSPHLVSRIRSKEYANAENGGGGRGGGKTGEGGEGGLAEGWWPMEGPHGTEAVSG